MFRKLKQELQKYPNQPVLVFHCSSLGEWEQARPIVEALKAKFDEVVILVTFFSPSGYEYMQDKEHPIDIISYAPFDLPWKVRRFFSIVRPKAYFIVRYDAWPNHIRIAHHRNIPVYLLGASLREKSKRIQTGVVYLFRKFYQRIDRVFCISKDDAKRFIWLMPKNKIEIIGDTRYDRVIQRKARPEYIIPDEIFPTDKRYLIAGSTYSADESILLYVYTRLRKHFNDIRLVIAPHEPTPEHIADLLRNIQNFPFLAAAYSIAKEKKQTQWDILLIDHVGFLADLYAKATLVYVGGAMHHKIHNVMEPAAHAKPMLFGPRIENSHEAQLMVAAKGAVTVMDERECYTFAKRLLQYPESSARMGFEAFKVIDDNAGATQKMLDVISANIVS